MLNWTIETTRGVFEGMTMELTIQGMIRFYGENDRDPKQICRIYACDDSGELSQQVSKTEISEIQERVKEEVAEWREKADEEAEGFRAIQSDYYASLI